MDDYVYREGPIDPEVRAYVQSLVTALGGSSTSADGHYILGDDALACLKDIKRWLKLHDEKLNRLDVTRCLAEANLVKGDLLEILGSWPEDALDERWRGRIALACFELLGTLTWPMERDIASEMTRNQHRHLAYIQNAQVHYKREILEHLSGDVLRKAVRLALPSMATPPSERTPRDEGILKLILYFVRNMAMISAPPNMSVEWNEQEVSRSATVRSFYQQDVFTVLLTMASNIAEDFRNQDVILLEVLFHLLKGVDPVKLFMSRAERTSALSKDLQGLMDKEDAMLRSYKKFAPSRHNRFGTMIWVKRDDEKVSTVSGQDVLTNEQQTLDKMDKSKKWNRPKRRKEEEKTHMNFDMPEVLQDHANEPLRKFVEDFLDAGFNPLFQSVRRAIEREAERVLETHSQQFWYLVSWFLRAESIRRKVKRDEDKKAGRTTQIDTFGIVANVLNQETFILLNRYLQSAYDLKEWNKVDAAMRCFTQILTTIGEMAESPLQDDQEIAENMQNNIFYESATHDRVLSILRTYKDQTFSYLDAVTELAHVFLRMLERYAKENGDLQIRTRRRARKLKRDAQKKAGQAVEDNADHGAEAEDNAAAAIVSSERKFSFDRFAAKFVNQATVDTFVKFLAYYRDLGPDQLKRVHRFFYRTAFKQDMSVLLYRIDIVMLLNRMVKSSDQLSKSNPMFLEFEELTRQLFKRLVRKMQERPELGVELLFSKIPQTTFYLEFGYEKQTISSKPRPPAELEVRGALSREDQIGVVVAVLMSDDKVENINWTVRVLKDAAIERQAWEQHAQATAADVAEKVPEANHQALGVLSGVEQAASAENAQEQPQIEVPTPLAIGVKPDSEARRLALFKDNKLRLLLTLAGAERVGDREDPEAPWYIPVPLTSSHLFETVTCIESHRDNPRNTYGAEDDDPIPAAEMLKRTAPPRAARDEETSAGHTFLDDDEDDGLDAFLAGEDEHLFPAGGPTNRKSALEELTKKRRRKRRGSSSEESLELDEATREARRRAKALRELEKRRKIKSEEFVHDSDDESDAEADAAFYKKEREIAERRQKRYAEEIQTRKEEESKRGAGKGKSKGKRKLAIDEDRSRAKRVRSSDAESSDPAESDLDLLNDDLSDAMEGVEGDSDEDDLFVGQRYKVRKSGTVPKSTSPIDISDNEESSGSDDDDAGIAGRRAVDDDEETPLSSQSEPQVEKLALAEVDGNRIRPSETAAEKMMVEADVDEDEDDEDDEDEAAVAPQGRRRAGRAAVLDDSDDE